MTISFASLAADASPVDAYNESGFLLQTDAVGWVSRTTYGNPGPFIQFWAAPGASAIGEVLVHMPTGRFVFNSVDLYSSTTPIPYEIAGFMSGATTLSLVDTLPNTFGAFRTVTATAAVPINALRIRLHNRAAACCRNPMGLDNLVLTR